MFKIAVIAANQVRKEEIRHIVQGESDSRQIMTFDDGLNQLASVAVEFHPDLIIIDGLSGEIDSLFTLEQFGQRYPGLAIIVLCENATSEFLVGAIRVGVKDVLPLNLNTLQAAVQRVESTLKPTPPQEKKGKVMIFVASKGGSGATFLACNLGYIFAKIHDVKVALLDLNLQFGDAALFVYDSQPSNTLADVADNILRLDASFLASSMVQVLPNFSVLAAPEDAEGAEDVKPEHIEALLKLAQSQYDYVIIDIGRVLNTTSIKALDHADSIFLVLQETLPFIRDSKRLINALQSLGYTKDKIHLILNRYEKGGDIQIDDVETTLGMKIFKTIPNSYQAVTASVNQGVPMLKIASHDSVTRALKEVAQQLIEGSEPKKFHWLASLIGR